MLFDDGYVDETFPNLSYAQWHIHSLHLQLFLVVVLVLDEERHVNINGLHTFLELYGSRSLCRAREVTTRCVYGRTHKDISYCEHVAKAHLCLWPQCSNQAPL